MQITLDTKEGRTLDEIKSTEIITEMPHFRWEEENGPWTDKESDRLFENIANNIENSEEKGVFNWFKEIFKKINDIDDVEFFNKWDQIQLSCDRYGYEGQLMNPAIFIKKNNETVMELMYHQNSSEFAESVYKIDKDGKFDRKSPIEWPLVISKGKVEEVLKNFKNRIDECNKYNEKKKEKTHKIIKTYANVQEKELNEAQQLLRKLENDDKFA